METAIEGNGLFLVGDRNSGNVEYTRKGSFGVSKDNYVTNTSGQYVLGYGVKTGTQEIDFSSRPSQFIFQWDQLLVEFKRIKATIGGNLPRNQNALSHEFTVF